MVRRKFSAATVFALIALIVIPAMPASARGAPDGFADLVEDLTPAVVNISSAQTVNSNFADNDQLRQFEDKLANPAVSLGSGFIISADGIVVTNNHVIDGADEVEVALPDGRVFRAEVVGIDSVTDLAVLRMDVDEPMPFVAFADSDSARVGDWVIAIGNPFGLGGTLTAGVVSARGREAGGRYDDYIQTDVAINTGNSGGPLFNMDGEVVGVNTLILSPTGASVGISLSIPSNLAEIVVNQLVEFGETRRGWLGVSVLRVTPEMAESFELATPYGAIVSRIEEDGPAAGSGLRNGDLVLQFDGRRVRDSRSFPRMVAETEIGREVELDIIRRDRPMTVSVTIGELSEGDDDGATANAEVVAPTPANGNEIMGMTFGTLDTASRRRFRVHPDAEGVLVTEVDATSDAAGKVRPGDVIEEVEFTRVDSVAAIREIVDGHGGGPVRFQINRGGQYVLQSIRP